MSTRPGFKRPRLTIPARDRFATEQRNWEVDATGLSESGRGTPDLSRVELVGVSLSRADAHPAPRGLAKARPISLRPERGAKRIGSIYQDC